MALLERVAMLVRANINDLIERSEDPDKMIKQVSLDMRNQLLQVKTQVAIAIASEHLLRKRKAEQDEQATEWMRKADIALAKEQDDLARQCLGQSLSARANGAAFEPQIVDQSAQVENLKAALLRLQAKLAETESQADILIARNRRSRMMQRASEARLKVEELGETGDLAEGKILEEEARGLASSEIAEPTTAERVAKFEREDEVERMLAELKAKRK